MLAKDRIIIVCYLDVSDLAPEDVGPFLDDALTQLNRQMKDESCSVFAVPIKGETRIECINPVLLDESQYEDTKQKLERIELEWKKVTAEEQ